GGDWAAASGQYAQAYEPGLVESCVRQILFVRPGTLIVVDQLKAPVGKSLNQVDWLLQLAYQPAADSSMCTVSNGTSWLACRPLAPNTPAPTVQTTSVNTWRARYRYTAQNELVLVHRLETGDGEAPDSLPAVDLQVSESSIDLIIGRWSYSFSRGGNYEVQARRQNPGDVNEDDRVDVFDLLALLQQIGGKAEKTRYADVDDNGRVDIFDLLGLLKLIAGRALAGTV
ncbi:MAG TPA: dockerin type I repeat-containing protein, partial [Candidatus Glassbacteria bacterium]|nr:dockerin type I repeat-containing protein [Candidatus Glassbacteria bacterium]